MKKAFALCLVAFTGVVFGSVSHASPGDEAHFHVSIPCSKLAATLEQLNSSDARCTRTYHGTLETLTSEEVTLKVSSGSSPSLYVGVTGIGDQPSFEGYSYAWSCKCDGYEVSWDSKDSRGNVIGKPNWNTQAMDVCGVADEGDDTEN